MEWIQKPSDLGVTKKVCVVYKQPCFAEGPACGKYYQSCKTKIHPTSK